MCIFEFDEEKFLKSEREWSYNSGREAGHAETLIKDVDSLIKKLEIDLQEACEILEISVEQYENAKEKVAVQ